MTTSRIAILGFGSLCLAFSLGANAGGTMSDSSHITNGGTGYIGLTESAGQSRHMNTHASVNYLPAGEASTMVNGRPNVHPNSPTTMSGRNDQSAATMGAMGGTRSMGASSSAGMSSMASSMSPGMNRHQMWGTPD